MPSDHRVSQALLVRSMGAFLALVGAAVFLLALVVGVLGLPVVVLSVGVALALLAVVAAGVLASRAASVVRFDDTGYQVRLLRRAGVRRARWRDVEDVVTATLSGQPCAVIRLRDGGTTTIPLATVNGPAEAFLRDLRDHLDRGQGRRRTG